MKVTDTEFASESRNLTLKGPGEAPSISYSIYDESLNNLNAWMEYKINEGDFQPVGDIKSMELGTLADTLTTGKTCSVTVRRVEGVDIPVSRERKITVYPRPEPPKQVGYDSSTYILSGLTKNKMEYREVGTSQWIKIAANELNMKNFINAHLDKVQIEIRYIAENGIFASKPILVNLYN